MSWPERIKRWLARHGVTDTEMAIAALAISIEDLKRELRRSRRSQRELHDRDDDSDEEE
jgi:hypothetical protein